jgi:hypothetical protein
VSAHPLSQRRGWLSALVAQVTDYVFEEVEETVEPAPVELEPRPVIALVSAAPRSGTTTLARLLAAELAGRAGGAAVVTSGLGGRRAAPAARTAIRLATALSGAAAAQPCGRLCVVRGPGPSPTGNAHALVSAARYLAPVVLDVPADGSGAEAARLADGVAVVASATAEPALLDAVANVLGGDPVKVVNRVGETGDWQARADLVVPESRLGIRASALGAKALGPLGGAIAQLADVLEARCG